jgi:hypothetical protein
VKPVFDSGWLKSKPSAYALTILTILFPKQILKVLLLSDNDSIVDQKNRREKGEENPERIKHQRDATIEQYLTEVIRVAAKTIWSGDDEMTGWLTGRNGSPHLSKVVDDGDAESQS